MAIYLIYIYVCVIETDFSYVFYHYELIENCIFINFGVENEICFQTDFIEIGI